MNRKDHWTPKTRRVFLDVCTKVFAGVGRLPDQLAVMLAGESDEEEINAILENTVDEITAVVWEPVSVELH